MDLEPERFTSPVMVLYGWLAIQVQFIAGMDYVLSDVTTGNPRGVFAA